jgi:foldase protein PrsA
VRAVVSKTLRITAALGAVLFALVGLSACGGGIPGDAVATVGGNSITKTTFNHWMSVASSSSKTSTTAKAVVPEPPNYTTCISNLAATSAKPAKGQKAPTTAQLKTQCETQYKTLKTEVLGFLISLEWVLGEAKSLGVNVTDAEVKKDFVKVRTSQFPSTAEFEKFLATSGQTVSDLLLRVKQNLVSQKIQTKVLKSGGKVTQAEIQKYYNEHKSSYGTPEKRKVEIVLTKTEAAAASAKKGIESGKSFASVAKAVSIDPTTNVKGGLLPEVVKGEEEKALDTAIFSAKLNTLGGPVKTPFGYYVYEVLGSTPGNQQTLAQAQTAIKQELTSTKQQSSFTKFVKNFKAKWKAKTECRTGFVVEDCKSYKAPKTGATGTAATGSAATGSAE